MKKIFSMALLMLCIYSAKSQSYMGFLTDNYRGVHGVLTNPASIADSRFKTDINLIGASAFLNNDYFGVKFSDVIKSEYEFEDDAIQDPKGSNNFLANTDILGPAFMFNIKEKHTIALYTRARAFVNLNDINGTAIDGLVNNFDENIDFNVDQINSYASTNGWAEFGVSYATILMNKEQHFLKGGITLKYLKGFANAYTTVDNVSLDFDANVATNNGQVTTTGDVAYGYSTNTEDLDDYEFGFADGSSGFGVDLGFEYEWRPDYKEFISTDSDGKKFMPRDVNKYKLKFGLSVTDLGSVGYEGTEERYNFDNTITQNDFEDVDVDELERFYTILPETDSQNGVLPTAIHANADWNINNYFYVNLNTDFSITSKNKANRSRVANVVSLTPRFERKWFSFYVPLSLVQHSGFQWGAGLRAGPLYIGSGSVFSVLLGNDTRAADFYAGLKIPVYHSRPKDQDGDGVLDKVDECPEKPGPKENYGCPWPDTDGDTVLDKDDKCPEEAGEVDNDGCPWLDTDGDGLLDKDDGCPDIAGPIENSGCPWPDTDGDGVLDKDDNCPDVPGTVANNGCPEVTEEVQKTLNEYAKTILFDSGKSSIKAESNKVLADIVNILKEYPTAKFTVDGHTDSAGSAKLNQRLSDSRANAVKDYLVSNGIDQFRLSAAGYGEDRPIATNKTRAGRAQNRRVEINLVK